VTGISDRACRRDAALAHQSGQGAWRGRAAVERGGLLPAKPFSFSHAADNNLRPRGAWNACLRPDLRRAGPAHSQGRLPVHAAAGHAASGSTRSAAACRSGAMLASRCRISARLISHPPSWSQPLITADSKPWQGKSER